MTQSQSMARVFISSTFRDFGEERDLLVRRVFPALRAQLRERFVELVDVDLRWGITAEQSERGEVLPICLAEIDRARPWFVCMLGDRYGWVPPADHYEPALVEERPWLGAHQGGKSVTELEILHGVLNDPAMAGRAFFYFRDPAYARTKGDEYLSASPEDARRLADLKDRIRASGFPVVEDYPTPKAMAERLEADLSAALDLVYPVTNVPDPFEREQRRHEAYAVPRRRLYRGGERYMAALDAALAAGQQRILIGGASGGGKSALMANWLHQHQAAHPSDNVHAYYLGASGDATDPEHLVRHLIEHIRRVTGSEEAVPGDRQALFDSLPTWLAYASAHAERTDTRWLIAIDGLNTLADLRDLRWFPAFLPERVHLVVSCLPGEVETALHGKGAWHVVPVAPLDQDGARQLLRAYLGLYNKTLSADLEIRALSHPLAQTPLFLRTLAEELRLFGSHEALSERLDYYLQSRTVDDLFERVLERVEGDCGADTAGKVMTALWASRAGLTESEILAYAGLVAASWAAIRYALNNALLESGGRLTFAHDYLRIAVSDRYMAGNGELAGDGQSEEAMALRRKAHIDLAQWFDGQFTAARAVADGEDQVLVDAARAAEEVPYQWHAARAWDELKACLTRKEMFEVIYATRSNEELLGYWLDLEHQADADLERDYEQAWAAWDLDEQDEATGDLSDQLASFLQDAGRYEKFTTKLAQLTHDVADQMLGPEHPTTGSRISNLALLLQEQGDYAAAAPLFRRALAIAEKAQGPAHSCTGTRLNNLAGLLEAQGDYVAAEPLYRRALAIAENADGPQHPSTGTSLNNLALLLTEQGNYAVAEPLLRRALAIAEITEGPVHPNTGACLNNLALLLKEQGDFAAAEPLYRRGLAIVEKAKGPEHPDTGTFLNNLAILQTGQGDYVAAEALYRRALSIAEKAQGIDHPTTGTSLNNLALLLKKSSDYAASALLLRRALAIAEKVLGPEHPDTGTRLNNLAGLLMEQGEYAAAEPLYRRALAIAETTQGAEPKDTARVTNNLGVLLRNSGQFDKAQIELESALRKWDALGDELGKAATLSALGKLCELEGRHEAALAYYERCLEIRERLLPSDDPALASVEERIALLQSPS